MMIINSINNNSSISSSSRANNIDDNNKNIVNLELLGSCEACPMSPMTLKGGVEESIMRQVPEITGINAINSSN